MKNYPKELAIHADYFRNKTFPVFSKEQMALIMGEVQNIRKSAKVHSSKHLWLQLLPFLVLISAWAILMFVIMPLSLSTPVKIVILGIVHGIIGYQWVIYGMHEGAGHGLFREKNSLIQKILSRLAFHSCRLFFADAGFYHKAHKDHHRYLGTEKDSAYTNYVLAKRIIVSMLPGAGILFPNDYRIHKGEDLTPSLLFSALVGGIFLGLEIIILHDFFTWWQSLFALVFIGPWIGLGLDRIRESLEHHLMPADRIYGTRELGLSPLALFISGGPWGQPCHFCHHIAQDLTWYQQISLHKKIKKYMTTEQLNYYGFSSPSIVKLILATAKDHWHLERKPKRTQDEIFV